jgi:hypothetical protein
MAAKNWSYSRIKTIAYARLLSMYTRAYKSRSGKFRFTMKRLSIGAA